jgi:transposase
VDVSSSTLETRIGIEGASASFSNTAAGIGALADFCRTHRVELVAMEATGGYEQQAYALLSAQGVPVAILNPRAVRRFACSMGREEKTDAIDAGMIAWYAAVKQSRPLCLPPASSNCVPWSIAPPTKTCPRGPLVTRLRQLTEVRTAQLNQSRLVINATVAAPIEEMLSPIARQIHDLETAIAGLVAQDPLWRELDQAFGSIKGVADRTVARLMAELPEIGTLSNKTVSKLAGLARLARDSGKHRAKRQVRGGRAAVRENPLHSGQRGGPLRARLHRLPATTQRRRQAAQGRPHRPGSQASGSTQRQSPPGAATNGSLHTAHTGAWKQRLKVKKRPQP